MADGGFSDARELEVLRWYFENVNPASKPTSFWVGLFSTRLLDDGSNIAAAEVSYAGATPYARQELTTGQWQQTAAAVDPTSLENSVVVTFPQCNEVAGTAAYWGLLRSVAGVAVDDLLFSGTVLVPSGGLALNPGVVPQFIVGALRVQLGSVAL